MNGRHGRSLVRGYPGPQEIRNRNCRDDQNNRHNNQQLNKRESILVFFLSWNRPRFYSAVPTDYESMPRAILHFVGAHSTSLNQTKYSIYRPGKQSACRPEKDDLKISGVPQNAQELVKHCHPAGCLAHELCWYFQQVRLRLIKKKGVAESHPSVLRDCSEPTATADWPP